MSLAGSSSAVLVSSTVTYCTAASSAGSAVGGATHLQSSDMTLSGSTVANCIATSSADVAYGGAMFLSSSSMTLSGATVGQYFTNIAWLRGISLDITGALVGLVALGMLPISIAQPISGSCWDFCVFWKAMFLNDFWISNKLEVFH